MEEKYKEDLKEIKEMMSRSSRFISLSGISGISTGITALIGAYIAHRNIFSNQDYLNHQLTFLSDENMIDLMLIAFGTIIITLAAGIFFTTRETAKRNLKVWDLQTKRLLISLSIPLVTGGILCLMLLHHGYIGIIIPLTLIFYGLALINASKYTLDELRSLGLMQILLGLLGIFFISYGLIIWAIGFGLLHIVYGIIMQLKYKS